jgi:hypothetical protein
MEKVERPVTLAGRHQALDGLPLLLAVTLEAVRQHCEASGRCHDVCLQLAVTSRQLRRARFEQKAVRVVGPKPPVQGSTQHGGGDGVAQARLRLDEPGRDASLSPVASDIGGYAPCVDDPDGWPERASTSEYVPVFSDSLGDVGADEQSADSTEVTRARNAIHRRVNVRCVTPRVLTASTSKSSSSPSRPSQRRSPRPKTIGTMTRCMESMSPAARN